MQVCNRYDVCLHKIERGWANLHFMADKPKDTRAAHAAKGKKDVAGDKGKKNPGEPDWTEGLKRLYDSVVDEPLPESFRELLAKLDSED